LIGFGVAADVRYSGNWRPGAMSSVSNVTVMMPISLIEELQKLPC